MNKDKVPAPSEGPFWWSLQSKQKEKLRKQSRVVVNKQAWVAALVSALLLHTGHAMMPSVHTSTDAGQGPVLWTSMSCHFLSSYDLVKQILHWKGKSLFSFPHPSVAFSSFWPEWGCTKLLPSGNLFSFLPRVLSVDPVQSLGEASQNHTTIKVG